jgi:transposase-like protein
MNEYSETFKSKMVQQLVGPKAMSPSQLSKETGVPVSTLGTWLSAARRKEVQGSKGQKMVQDELPKKLSSLDPAVTTTAPTPRRAEDWKPEERLRVVVEVSRLSGDELGAMLRREGLYEATVREWQASVLQALGSSTLLRTEAKRIKHLELELLRKDRALAEAAALLILQKKAQNYWGAEDDDTLPRSDK